MLATGTRRREKKVTGTEGDSKLQVAIQALQGTAHPVGLWQERIVGVQYVSFWLKRTTLFSEPVQLLANQFKASRRYSTRAGGVMMDE